MNTTNDNTTIVTDTTVDTTVKVVEINGDWFLSPGEPCVACGYPIALGGYHGLCCWCGG